MLKRLKLICFLIGIVSYQLGYAAIITSKAGGGNWTTGSTWVGNIAPSAADEVVIAGPVTINTSVTCSKLTVNSSRTLTINSPGTLTLAKNATATVISNSGSIVTNTNTIFFYSNTNAEHTITGTGNITFHNITAENVGLKLNSSRHTVNNIIHLNTGAWIETQPTYGVNATVEIDRSIVSPQEWHLSKIWPAGNTSTVAPNISFVSGTTNMNWLSDRYIRKSLSISNGATLNAATTCFILPSTFVNINNSGTVTLGGIKVENGATWNINANYTISDLFILTGGTVNANNFTLTLTQTAGGSCNGSGGEVFEVQSGGNFNAGTGTVAFNLPYWGEIKVLGTVTFNNLSLESNTLEITNGTNITVNGNLSLEEGGDLTGSGSGELTYGPEATLIINTPYTIESWEEIPWGDGSGTSAPPNVVVNSTLTLTDNKEVTGNIVVTESGTISGATNLILDDSSTITSCGSLSGTPQLGSNVTVNTCGNTQIGTELNGAGTLVVESNDTLTVSANITLGSPGNIIVEAGGRLNMVDKTITCNNVTILGTLRTTNLNGISGAGSSFGNATITIDTGSTVEYYAAAGNQTITPRTDYYHLFLNAASNKIFTNNATYELRGNFDVSGQSPQFGNNTVINFKGTTQYINCNQFHKVTFSNTGSKIITIPTEITGQVNLNGSANLVTNNQLKLISTNAATAAFGPISASAQITGNVTIERYIGPSRKWRFLSLPLSGATFQSSWQNQIHITGPGTGGSIGNTNSNGFDFTAANQPSILFYDESIAGTSSQRWVTIPNTSANINSAKGYRVFVRGNKVTQGNVLIDGSNYTPQAVTLSASGTIVKGQQVVSLTCSHGCNIDDGWNLVSNPYPSTIDWDNPDWMATRNPNISNTIYIYNPNTNQYAAWNPIGGGVNGGSQYIASGESFFIKTSGNANLVFEENYKVYQPAVGLHGKSGSKNNLKIQLKDTGTISECVIFYEPSSTKLARDRYDGPLMSSGNGIVSTYTSQSSTRLVFNAIPATEQIDTIFIAMPMANATRTYELHFNGASGFNNKVNLYLVDQFTQQTFALNTLVNGYKFYTQSGNLSSNNTNRFMIIMNAVSALPVEFTYLRGTRSEKATILQWETASEHNNSHFEIERSFNAIDFEPIGVVKGKGNSNQTSAYRFTDDDAKSQQRVYYRLKQVDFDNRTAYSNTIVIDALNDEDATVTGTIKAFPNPAKESIQIECSYGKIPVKISITDITGKVLTTIDGNGSSELILSVEHLQKGLYLIDLTYQNGTIESIKFIKD